jgi:hypothetical protein
MTFAAAIARATASVHRHLVTHDAVLDHVAVSGLLDNGSRPDALGLITASEPSFTMATADCLRAQQGSRLRVVDVGSFIVIDVLPDGTGTSVLRLQRA